MTILPSKVRSMVFGLLLASLVAGCSAGAQMTRVPQAGGGGAPYRPGEVLVRVLPGANKSEIASAVGATILGEISRLNVLLLRLPAGRSVEDAIRALQARADVLFAEPNYVAEVPENDRPTGESKRPLPMLPRGPGLFLMPNDPAYPAKLWGLVKIGAEAAWEVTTGGSNVVIAVLDTGVDAGHPDLAGKVLPGANCVNQTSCTPGGASDGHGHGTHVAGTAAALGNNNLGIVGVAFNAVTRILPVKVLGDDGSGSFAGVAAGIVWAADTIAEQGKRGILNMSLGGFLYSQVLQDAVAYANRVAGGSILVVAAMGNEYKRWQIVYPAALTGVMAVGATDGNDLKVPFSNTGPHISVGAPGLDVYSTIPGGAYAYFSGTSMATPHVAGLAALVWSAFPAFTNYQVRSKIEGSATDVGTPGWDESFGWGRINAAAAVTGGAPAPYYGCLSVTAQTAGPTPQPGSDVVVTSGNFRATTKTDASGVAVLDFLPSGSYTITASKVIGGAGHYGTASTSVAPTGPTTCASVTITMTP